MQEETIKQARVLLGAGIDDDTIITSLGISINDLEKIKTGEVKEPRKAPLPQNNKGKFIGKITEEVFADLKKRINAKPSTTTANAFCAANSLSLPTYYRIKNATDYAEYRAATSATVIASKGLKDEKRPTNAFNEMNKAVKNEEDFNRLKEAMAKHTGTVSDFSSENGFSNAIYYRLKKADSFADYQKLADINTAKRRLQKRKWRAEKKAKTNGLTVEEAVKIIEPYAIPKEEPKKVPTQVEVLERIATQLERLADYEQMKLSKKRWFRKVSK